MMDLIYKTDLIWLYCCHCIGSKFILLISTSLSQLSSYSIKHGLNKDSVLQFLSSVIINMLCFHGPFYTSHKRHSSTALTLIPSLGLSIVLSVLCNKNFLSLSLFNLVPVIEIYFSRETKKAPWIHFYNNKFNANNLHKLRQMSHAIKEH